MSHIPFYSVLTEEFEINYLYYIIFQMSDKISITICTMFKIKNIGVTELFRLRKPQFQLQLSYSSESLWWFCWLTRLWSWRVFQLSELWDITWITNSRTRKFSQRTETLFLRRKNVRYLLCSLVTGGNTGEKQQTETGISKFKIILDVK